MKLARLTNVQKAKLWDNPLAGLPPMLDPDFRWQTMAGEIMTTREMSTWHLFNSLKMIWNHTVAPQFRFMPYKPYHGIDGWHGPTRRRAVHCLFHELSLRPDITQTMKDVLQKMALYIQQNIRATLFPTDQENYHPKQLTNAKKKV